MKLFFTWVRQKIAIWRQPEIQIQHQRVGNKQFIRMKKRSMSVGTDASNDLILLSENMHGFEGTLIVQSQQILFLTDGGQKKTLTARPINIGGFLFCRVSRIWTATPFLITALCFCLLAVQFGSAKPKQDIVPLAISLPAKGTYGHQVAGYGSTKALLFSFDASEPHAMTLFFSPGNIPKSDTVILELNGHPIDVLPPSVNTWAREIRVGIDPKHIQKGKNHIRFVTASVLPAPWGVRNVYIQKSQPVNQVDPVKWYRVAQKLFLERNAISGNLLRSKQAMLKSLKALKQQHQPIPKEYQALYKTIVSEQKQLFESTLRQARLLVRNQDKVRAKIYYQKILREMIDPMSKNRSTIQLEMYEADL